MKIELTTDEICALRIAIVDARSVSPLLNMDLLDGIIEKIVPEPKIGCVYLVKVKGPGAKFKPHRYDAKHRFYFDKVLYKHTDDRIEWQENPIYDPDVHG